MKAEQMFKKLGYVKTENEDKITYMKKDDLRQYVIFHKTQSNQYALETHFNQQDGVYEAIGQQEEELGWHE